MHQQGIVHRDLKLENVVYESKLPDSDIFIIDYGLSKVCPTERRPVGMSLVLPACVRSTDMSASYIGEQRGRMQSRYGTTPLVCVCARCVLPSLAREGVEASRDEVSPRRRGFCGC